MSVTYRPEHRTESDGHHGHHLTEGPKYVHTPGTRYWHRVRSGVTVTADWHEPWQVVRSWCGQSRNLTTGITHGQRVGPVMAADEVPAGAEVCSTCEGRAVGAGSGSDVVTVRGDVSLIFSPRLGFCPASETTRYHSPDLPHAHQIVQCDECSTLCLISNRGGPYSPSSVIRKHRTPEQEAIHQAREAGRWGSFAPEEAKS